MKNNLYKHLSLVSMLLATIYIIIFILDRYNDKSNNIMWMLLASVQLVIIIISARTINRLFVEINKDSLTGLWNKGYFNSSICNAYVGTRVTLILIDIDNFKSINDTFGHSIGDGVLKQVALLLGLNTRETDLVVRWGGEEIVIILPNTNIVEAQIIAERIRKTSSEFNFVYEDSKFSKTISSGIATKEQTESMCMEELFRHADLALQKAKLTKSTLVLYDGALRNVCK